MDKTNAEHIFVIANRKVQKKSTTEERSGVEMKLPFKSRSNVGPMVTKKKGIHIPFI